MPTIQALPRETPADRNQSEIEIEVDEQLENHAEIIEEWIDARASWEFTLREGTEFDRPNNVEGELMFVAGEQTSALRFRLDQLDEAIDTGVSGELVLRFETEDGIAKLARLTANGLDVELFHILTFT